ncbi:kinase-like protein [Ascobolus immersus RN42]|uniref:Autophagy-related protein 1 n=1 Tax=Ascobolus immersus RN42 TaxID=1160509 RepID=A0A3N4HDS8_ASCIM|nr:kinase-like protein [Ascobolus immersus RN42]
METSSNSYVASWSGATSKATASHLPAVLNTTSLRLILSYITASDRLAKGSSSGGNTVERLVTGAHLEGGKRIGHGKTFTAEKRRIDSDEGWIVIKRTKVGKEDSEGTLATRIQVAFLEQHILSYYSEISEHPNIIKYHGWGWTLKDLDRAAAVSLFLALEYCEMGTLSSFLRNTAGLSDTQKWQFCLGISRGLEVLHKHGIAHGDVKLANILVTYDHVQDMPIAKISDFGNARLCEALPNIAGLLQFTDYLGTHMYNAPEVQAQFGGATKVTAELFPYCDIFSFGLCCIEVFNNGNRYDTHMEKGEEMKRLLFSFRGSEPKMTQKLKDVEFNQCKSE